MRIVSEIISLVDQQVLEECFLNVLDNHQFLFSRHIEGFTKSDVLVRLFPLSRFTPSAGYSGADIFIARFEYNETKGGKNKKSRSNPIIVKIGSYEKLRVEEDFTKFLESESENLSLLKQYLSLPFRLIKSSKCESCVLLTKFEVSENLGNEESYSHLDLWRMLHDKADNKANIKTTLASVSKGLECLQSINSGIVSMTYGEALKGYARGLEPSNEEMCEEISFQHIDSVFKEHGELESAAGRLFKEVLQSDIKHPWKVSAIHGDLHPKNIVKGVNTKLIDFGWARKQAPSILDYLLLDINLRASTLSPYANRNTVRRMCNTLAWADIKSPNIDFSPCSFCRDHMSYLQEYVWAPISGLIDSTLLNNADGSKVNEAHKVQAWDQQYVVPLFVLSYALLKYLDDTTNQTALIQLVKSSSDYLLNRNYFV